MFFQDKNILKVRVKNVPYGTRWMNNGVQLQIFHIFVK